MKLTEDIYNFFGNLPGDMKKLGRDIGEFLYKNRWVIIGALAVTGLLVLAAVATAGIAPVFFAGVVGAVSAFGVAGLTVGGVVSTIGLGATAAIVTASTFAVSLGVGFGLQAAWGKLSGLFAKKEPVSDVDLLARIMEENEEEPDDQYDNQALNSSQNSSFARLHEQFQAASGNSAAEASANEREKTSERKPMDRLPKDGEIWGMLNKRVQKSESESNPESGSLSDFKLPQDDEDEDQTPSATMSR